MNEQKITLDLSKEQTIAPVIYLGQGDANGTTIIANIYDNGLPFSFSSNNKSAKLVIRLPDGETYYETTGTTAGNVATFAIDETYAASVAGVTDVAYVEAYQGTTYIASTNRFRVVILESAEEGVDPSRAYHNGIFEAIDRANAAAEAAEGVVLQDVPLMSATVRGGAQVGDGLRVTDGALSVDDSTLVPQSEKGAANGVAELDQNGLVISSQLPSYVDDVLEYASASEFPATGESGKIYVATDTNLTYRWTGTGYAEISPSLALGETSSTAYRGDRGAAAYAHAVTNKGSAFSSDLYKITTNSEGHVTAATPATPADIIAFLNEQAITPASVTASGAIQGSSISDGVGTLAQLRESVSRVVTYPFSNNLYVFDAYDRRGIDAGFRFTYNISEKKLAINIRVTPDDPWHTVTLNMN